MKVILFPIAFLAAAVSAQTTSVCAADYIVETCLNTGSGALSTCDDNGYSCKCSAYKQMVQCFNNCPNDTRVSSYEGQQTIFCDYATQFPESTTKAVSAAVTTSSTAATTTTASETPATTASGTKSNTGTAAGSATSATGTNSAADILINAGGVLAAVAGVVCAVL